MPSAVYSESNGAVFSTGVVPVWIEEGREPEFLLLRAYRYWDFPKGLPEDDEKPLTTALRELFEETGMERVELLWGETYFETEPYSRKKIARYYVGRALSRKVTLEPEHMQFLWLTREKALPLLVPRVRAVLEWAHRLIQPVT